MDNIIVPDSWARSREEYVKYLNDMTPKYTIPTVNYNGCILHNVLFVPSSSECTPIQLQKMNDDVTESEHVLKLSEICIRDDYRVDDCEVLSHEPNTYYSENDKIHTGLYGIPKGYLEKQTSHLRSILDNWINEILTDRDNLINTEK